MERNYLEIDEVAEFLRISPATIQDWLRTRNPNKFKKYCTRIGRRPIITHENLDRYLHDLPARTHNVNRGDIGGVSA